MGVAYAKGIAQFLNLEPKSTNSVGDPDEEGFLKPTFYINLYG